MRNIFINAIRHAFSLSGTGIPLCSKVHIRSKECPELVNTFEELFKLGTIEDTETKGYFLFCPLILRILKSC